MRRGDDVGQAGQQIEPRGRAAPGRGRPGPPRRCDRPGAPRQGAASSTRPPRATFTNRVPGFTCDSACRVEGMARLGRERRTDDDGVRLGQHLWSGTTGRSGVPGANGSAAMVRSPKPRARSPTFWPMRPAPRMPSVLPLMRRMAPDVRARLRATPALRREQRVERHQVAPDREQQRQGVVGDLIRAVAGDVAHRDARARRRRLRPPGSCRCSSTGGRPGSRRVAIDSAERRPTPVTTTTSASTISRSASSRVGRDAQLDTERVEHGPLDVVRPAARDGVVEHDSGAPPVMPLIATPVGGGGTERHESVRHGRQSIGPRRPGQREGEAVDGGAPKARARRTSRRGPSRDGPGRWPVRRPGPSTGVIAVRPGQGAC